MDLELVETGDGGDLIKLAKDLSVIYGFENMSYMAMFGGNIEQSTPLKRKDGEQGQDWWGNELLFPNDPDFQFNSQTERTLQNTAITSFGLTVIKAAVVADHAFMSKFAKVNITVSSPKQDYVVIGVQIVKPDNLNATELIWIWDATMSELVARENFGYNSTTKKLRLFDDYFSFEFE